MCDPFVGEIRIWAGQKVPVNWAFCQGQALLISQYETLYALIGTTYGGDGQTNFNLPDLRGKLPIGQGQGAGLTNRVLAQSVGETQVTLTAAQMPVHSHTLTATTNPATTADPTGALLGVPASSFYENGVAGGAAKLKNASPKAVSNAGGDKNAITQPHANLMPSMGINYMIATIGIYPQQP